MGALYLRAGTHILGHSRAARERPAAGTEDVAGAIGMAVAFGLAVAERDATAGRLRRGRDRLLAALTAVEGAELTGHPKDRLPGLVSVIVRDVEGASVVVKLDLEGVAASVGSACTTGSAEPSHVLAAMGYPEEEARGALRFSLGRATLDAEVDEAVAVVPRIVAEARAAAILLAAERASPGSLPSKPPAGTDTGSAIAGRGSAVAG